MSRDLVFELANVSHTYQTKTGGAVLTNVSGNVGQGECLVIMGPSGSGKSTLLHILGLIEPLKSGELWFLGESVVGLNDRMLSDIRRFKLGFIFQAFYLLDALTVAENVEYFLVKQKLPKSERMIRVGEALRAVGLEAMRNKFPLELSGGQRQRVAIARALAKHPRVIIADEPTANLDQETARGIFSVFRDLTKAGVTIVMASHDPLATQFANRVVKLVDGHVEGGL